MQNDKTTHPKPTDLLPPNKHSFTVSDLATLLGVNHKTVRGRLVTGDIKVVRLSRAIRIMRSEVERLIAE